LWLGSQATGGQIVFVTGTVYPDSMRIDQYGQVGIGTSAPQTQLEVAGSGYLKLDQNGRTGSMVFGNNTGAAGAYSHLLERWNRIRSGLPSIFSVQTDGDASGNWPAITFDAHNISSKLQNRALFAVGSNPASPTDYKLIVGPTGNVGIGVPPSATSKLAVNGTVSASELIVTSSPGADYVFDSGYQLKPLDEVAAYISANHHLPDVPSADEMKQNGIGVAEMQMKLLAKIEELTLHMIAADERVRELEKQNRELREKNSGAVR
jgi:hypothetical protein